MRVKLTLENVGHPMSKAVELPAPPTLGMFISLDGRRGRKVNGVTYDVDREEYVVSLTEDEADLATYAAPEKHLRHLETMMAKGWSIEAEGVQRMKLEFKIDKTARSG
jgi:hypothetical protein